MELEYKKLKILIVGGTGFIGSHLHKYFSHLGATVFITSRNVDKLLNNTQNPYNIIINLAGEPLNRNRWNNHIKKNIYESRILTTQKIVEYIKNAAYKPQLLISGSAIGFYGHHTDKVFTEETLPADNGFTHVLCRDWENVALEAQLFGVRVCLLRTGVVLGKDGGALKQMITPFKFGLGAALGTGKQWMSWIHIDDVTSAIDFIIKHPNLNGPFNLTAPIPVTNQLFSQTLADTLHRALFLRFPDFVVKCLFGEMGKALLLNGQKVIPHKLLQAGYQFKFPALLDALKNILR